MKWKEELKCYEKRWQLDKEVKLVVKKDLHMYGAG